MKIVTVSREFGSGGRELGKRLADALGFDYYDREIITQIASRHGLTEDYVEAVLDRNMLSSFPLTFHNSFVGLDSVMNFQTDLLTEQTKILRSVAKSGRDCVIVGRNADVILNDENPFNIFVCADMESRIARCRNFAQKHEKADEIDIEKNIKRIDKERAKSRELFSDTKWGDSRAYNLTVNTSGWSIKELAGVVSFYVRSWFDRVK